MLPALAYAISRCREDAQEPLRSWSVIATQHVQGSFVDLADALIDLGLEPSRFHVIPKLYSYHAEAMAGLVSRGIQLHGEYSLLNSSVSYERYAESMAYRAFQSLVDSGSQRVLVIDEGGRIGRCIDRMGSARRYRVCAVEQTTRGLPLYRRARYQTPVVSVAGSVLKRRDEAVFIAESMVESILYWLPHVPFDVSHDDWSFVIVGFGAIGSILSGMLKRLGWSVSVVDRNPENADSARRAGLEVFSDVSQHSGSRRVIVGCTGTRATNLDTMIRPPGLQVAMNCASSDTEFPTAAFRSVAKSEALGLTEQTVHSYFNRPSGWRELDIYRAGGIGTVLVNGGFPINFRGQKDTVGPVKFQLTRALMLMGAVQATRENRYGLVELALTPDDYHMFTSLGR